MIMGASKQDYTTSLNITDSVRLRWANKEIERLKLIIIELEKQIERFKK